MLFEQDEVRAFLASKGLKLEGVLHVGAHDCEELDFYKSIGISPESVIWIDALQEKVDQAKAKGIPNVYQGVISDKDGETVTFNVSNNVQSSSFLQLGTHAQQYPDVHYVKSLTLTTSKLDNFLEKRGIDAAKCSLWNFDIQGAELLALYGASTILKYAKVLYLEVNVDELYKGCGRISDMDAFLASYGFIRQMTLITKFGWGDAIYVRDI